MSVLLFSIMARYARLCASGFLFCLSLSAADVTGIWTGQIAARNNEKQDIAFQFKPGKELPVGVLFGDEFDLPVQDLNISAGRISFSVTSVNYYDGRKIKFVFSGTITDQEMQLTRERAGTDTGVDTAKRPDDKQTFTLKKLI